jgi:hypothetical protein
MRQIAALFGTSKSAADAPDRLAGEQFPEVIGIDPDSPERVIERPVSAAEDPGQRQGRQRGHRAALAQQCLGQLEQRVRSRGQAVIEAGTKRRQCPGARSSAWFRENRQTEPLLLDIIASQ